MSGESLGLIDQNPSVSKSKKLHVVIGQFSFNDLGYILHNPLKYTWLIGKKMRSNFPEVLNFNQLFLKLNQFMCN